MMISGNLKDFYIKSPMREGILCWYPFAPGAKALDLSGGVLTDLLNKRGLNVSSDAKGHGFDYIVLIDPGDMGLSALEDLKSRLNAHGRLLTAFENPFGLRYWSGKASPVTGLPYDSVLGRDGRPGKAEVQARLSAAGFKGQKWYYPLTDHWFTREVYSDSYLPDEFLNQRFIPYMDDDENLRFDERPLYREVIRGGAFEFMCGAYLAEVRACPDDPACPVDYAAVTAYRDPSKRFATTVRNDGTVRKTPLCEEGFESALRTVRNHEDLARMGVNVLPLRLDGRDIVMPRLNLPTLWDYWADKVSDGTFDQDEMFRHYDRIRDAIYKSSVNGTCYYELVPANCFYDKAKDELIFFDQEYCLMDTPPEAALARSIAALKYSLYFSRDPRSKSWVKTLAARYGLENKWDGLLEFVDGPIHGEVFGDGDGVLDQITKQAAARLRAESRRKKFEKVPDKLREMGYRRPIIYGYGLRGAELVRSFRGKDVKPAAIVDRKMKNYSSLEQVPPDRNADAVVVSVRNGEEIAKDLRERTNLPIYILEELTGERID